MTWRRLQRRIGQFTHDAAVGHVPQLDRVIVAAGGHLAAIRTERHSLDLVLMNQAGDLLASHGFKHPARRIRACRGHPQAIWTESHAHYRTAMIQTRKLIAAANIKDPGSTIFAPGNHLAAIGTESNRIHRRLVKHVRRLPAGPHFKNPGRARPIGALLFSTDRGQQQAITAEGNSADLARMLELSNLLAGGRGDHARRSITVRGGQAFAIRADGQTIHCSTLL